MMFLLDLFKPYLLKAAVVMACIAVMVAAYFAIRHEGVLLAQQEQYKKDVETYKASVAKAQGVSIDLQQKLNTLSTENEKLKERLSSEVALPVYHTCTVPSSGVRILNDARKGRSSD